MSQRRGFSFFLLVKANEEGETVTDLEQPSAHFDTGFWDEQYETLVVSDEAHRLLPAIDANIFDRRKQNQLRRLLDSPELARATKRWERWGSAGAAQPGRGAAA